MSQSPSNFAFLLSEWPLIHEAAARAEELAHTDARSACFHARRALELLVEWAFTFDRTLDRPHQSQISALVHEPSFKRFAGQAVFTKAQVIIRYGNGAVHSRPVQPTDALNSVRELFHVCFWFARTYARGTAPHPQLAYNPDALPKTTPIPKQTLEQLLRLQAELKARDEQHAADLANRDAEIASLREQVAAAKQAHQAIPDTHDYSEALTRDLFIDLLLKEAGWPLSEAHDREFEVTGMPNAQGTGTGYRRQDSSTLDTDIASLLHAEVAAMNVDNFVVRHKRRLVGKYQAKSAWSTLDAAALGELSGEVAGLPSELDPEDQESKRFDLLVLKLQLAVLTSDASVVRLSEQVKGIAALLEEKSSIPLVQQQLALIQDLQSDEWWEDVTADMLENVRRRLRSLIKLIDKRERKPIYTNFEDQLGTEEQIALPMFGTPDSSERFRAKARAFLKQHEDHVSVHKLRLNKPLTQSDLDELERTLQSSALGEAEELQKSHRRKPHAPRRAWPASVRGPPPSSSSFPRKRPMLRYCIR